MSDVFGFLLSVSFFFFFLMHDIGQAGGSWIRALPLKSLKPGSTASVFQELPVRNLVPFEFSSYVNNLFSFSDSWHLGIHQITSGCDPFFAFQIVISLAWYLSLLLVQKLFFIQVRSILLVLPVCVSMSFFSNS